MIPKVTYLKENWQFQKIADGKDLTEPTDNWETVRVPHDWAIYGPFDKSNDQQTSKIPEDQEYIPVDMIGRTGGLPIVGKAWYKKNIFIEDSSKNNKLFLEFDGVMSNSTVYVNDKKVGSWPYGYSSFSFEITDYIKFDSENIISVSVDSKAHASRWYPGSGIYRNVRLVETSPIHVKYHGTYITTPAVSNKKTTINVETTITNHLESRTVSVVTTIIDNKEHCVAEKTDEIELSSGENCISRELTIKQPKLWDIKSPNRYFAETQIIVDGETIDRYMTPFGIKTVKFDCNKGFFLNGEYLKLKGVCMHHDMGAIGTAVNNRAIERQLEILQDMGCNAIRTSHNPPTPELLDFCDKMGFLVIDEAFDEWRAPKVKNGYSNLFDEWAEKDLTAMIERDRNHPCIIMWSIGNEIYEIHDPVEGPRLTHFLQDICHRVDPTRPVTAGFSAGDRAVENGLADAIDIPGFNYLVGNGPNINKYEDYHKAHPEWLIYGSETESCVSSRGEYYLPFVETGTFCDENKFFKAQETLHINSYDMDAPQWGYAPEYEFEAQKKSPYIFGEFVWTGFDYLGEPTPYKTEWPSRSSYFGIVDLCGLPKNRFYAYQAEWSNKEVLHIFPHWNWNDGQEVPVHCYTNLNIVELFVNGKSYGRKEKSDDNIHTKYRIIWDNVKYEAGEIKAVAYDNNDKIVKTEIIKTADVSASISLKPDRSTINADGDDLCYITVGIYDKNGNICHKANNRVFVSVEGAAELIAVDNGDQTSLESFQADNVKAFNGLCMLTVRSTKNEGLIKVTVTSEGLPETKIQIKSK